MAAVSARYARALADAVTGGKIVADAPAIEAQLLSFDSMMKESADLRNVMSSPAVLAAKKKAVIEYLGARMGISQVTRNFLFVLVDQKRIGLLHEIMPLYRAEMDERAGMVEANVSSATPLNDVERGQLEAALAKKTGKKVRARYSIDPALIGGVVTRVGSTVYDGSVREHLRDLREKLSSQ
jgi:F-type H+-transporting ATPase subunit delta